MLQLWSNVSTVPDLMVNHCCFVCCFAIVKVVVQALFASQLPRRVNSAEVAEWLPSVDCAAVQDRLSNFGLAPSLSTLIAKASANVGE
jgi:hypothetical protein